MKTNPALGLFPVLLLGLLAVSCRPAEGPGPRESASDRAPAVRPLVPNDPNDPNNRNDPNDPSRPAKAPARDPEGAPGEVLLLDIDGETYPALADREAGSWTALFFIRSDCPISNRYAPEIRRICADYGEAGVDCFLVYIDPALTEDAARAHTGDFGYSLPAVLDRDHRLAALAGATITPEAAVFSGGAQLEYRGRIDNLYADLGRPRRQATERDLRNALDDLAAGRPVGVPVTQATGCFIE